MEMGIDAAEGKCLLLLLLLLLLGMLFEGVVRKSAVLTVIVLDSDALLTCKFSYACFDCSVSAEVCAVMKCT